MTANSRKAAELTTKSQAVWSRDSVPQLLAWLDLCREEGKTAHFYTTIIHRLQDTLNFSFTVVQVKNKLTYLARKEDSKRKIYRPLIHKFGSDHLSKLSSKDRIRLEEIKAALRPIFNNTLRKYMENQSLQIKGTTRLSNQKSQIATSKVALSTSTNQSEDFVTISANLYGKRKRSDTVHVQMDHSPRFPRRSSSFIEISAKDLISDEEYDVEKASDTYRNQKAQAERVTGAVVEHHTRDRAIRVASSLPSLTSRDCQEKLPDPVLDLTISPQLEKRLGTDQIHISAMFQILKDESSALHHRICMLENDNDVTKQCLRAPIDVAAMRYESNHLHEKNAALENHIEKLRDHEKNTLGMRSCELSARVRTLESDINDVCLKICSIFDATELSLPEENEQIYNGLFERALKPSSWSEITKSSAPSPLMSDAFRILSAIHVCVRIFEDRAFDSLTAVEPFLNGWRRMTLCDGGSDALRKFDLLGLSSSLRSKAFDRQVKAKAQALSHEIVATISDLTHQCGDHQFHPLRNIQSTAICLSDFESLFGNALKLKAELMLTGQEYTAFFVPSGTKFNPEMMEKAAYSIEEPCWKRRSGFSEDDERTNKPQTFTVNICLFPAICAYTSEPKRDRQAINWKTVRPLEDAWKRYYNIEDLKAMGAKTLSKAVVLLR